MGIKRFDKFVFTVSIVLLASLLSPENCRAVKGMVVIEAGGDEAFSLKIGENLTLIMNQLEAGDLTPVEHLFTPEGYQIISDVISLFPMTNANEVQKSRIISYPGGGWEVRDLRVFVKSGDADAAGMPWQYLVLA